MYSIKENILFSDSIKLEFNFNIRSFIEYFDKVIVLLSIPFTKDDINNIYCIDKFGKVVWQSENLNLIYPNLKNLPYEQMGIKDNILYASDFYSRNYLINVDTGKIEGCNIVK
ncbi:hypothetical protein [Clostridium sp.]|uniref:hypothetical protein n=1 Tax=Clostridium sp. TaxID=1506 RepID=UPI0026168D7F|nr:hypothetical protein [uncultured Clostridium sp.]